MQHKPHGTWEVAEQVRKIEGQTEKGFKLHVTEEFRLHSAKTGDEESEAEAAWVAVC